jgi:hypothetical protein
VSGCTHSDRELKQIAKKGRPVSQCPHCRHLRKSRSAHVKCDCGERHGKDAKKAGHTACCTGTHDKADKKACTCCHGGRCTCALKKESPSLHTVPQFQPELKRTSTTPTDIRRPRINSTQSEGSLTTFSNGHHKPTHRSHHSHSINPYTITGHAEHHRHSFLDEDDLPSPPMIKRRVKSDASPADLLAISRLHNNGLMALEHTSMELTPRQITPRQASARMQHGLSVDTNQSQYNFHEGYGQEFLQSADADPYQFSAGLHPPVGWPLPHSEIDWMYPGLTSCSSGDETDEQFNNASRSLTSTGPLPSEASDLGDDSYRLSATSSFIGVQTPSIMSSERSSFDMERFLIDYNPTETGKQFNLERYLSESSPPRSGFIDGGLNVTISGDSGYDADSHLFANTYMPHQEISDSNDALDLLASNLHSPAETGMLLGMNTSIGEDEGMVWMRKYSNASTYHSAMDPSWPSHSQAQSPR